MTEEANRDQGSSATWSHYFSENRDWLTKQIEALESMNQIKGERRPTLDLAWVLSLYRLARDYLDAFNESHTMLHEMKTSVEPLERRLLSLEAGSPEAARLPKIAIDRDALASMSKSYRRSTPPIHNAKGGRSRSRNQEPNDGTVAQQKRMKSEECG